MFCAAVEIEPQEQPEPAPTISFHVPLSRPQPASVQEEPQPDPDHGTVLREILHFLKSRHRQDLYEEFSFARFLAMLVETVALFCLVASLWFWLDSSRPVTSAQMMLGYAVMLQLAVIALLLIKKR